MHYGLYNFVAGAVAGGFVGLFFFFFFFSNFSFGFVYLFLFNSGLCLVFFDILSLGSWVRRMKKENISAVSSKAVVV